MQGESSELLPSVVVVGGRGAMGRFFVEFFKKADCKVDIIERGDPISREILGKYNVVLISVPMKIALKVASEIAPLVSSDALLCDVNSLKSGICEVFRTLSKGEALGMHPMFGPTVSSVKEQTIISCPVRSGPLTEWLLGLLQKQGARIVEEDPEKHDKMMAIVQVMSHFGTMVMGEAMRRCGIGVEETLKYTSPIYLIGLAIIGRQFAQDPELYGEIARQNPYGKEFRGYVEEAAVRLNKITAEGSLEDYKRAWLGIEQYFGDFTKEAMAISDFLIEALANKQEKERS